VPRRVALEDPLADFESESPFVPVSPIILPGTWPVHRAPTHAIDTTSRVISFVLGFALASVIAWLGSFSTDEIATAPPTASVATAAQPVVTATTEVTAAAPTIDKAAPTAPAVTTAAPSREPAPSPALPRPSVRAAAPSSPPALAAATPRAARQPAQSGYRGALALSSVPEGAQVLLNGAVVGQTPVVISDLPVGSRGVVVRREGYSPWSASVRVVANQRTTVRATLTKESGG
jgi:PEGA domain